MADARFADAWDWTCRLADGHAVQQHGQGKIQSVKRMKDSTMQKINKRERAQGDGRRKIKKKTHNNKKNPDSEKFLLVQHSPLEIFGRQSGESNKACEKPSYCTVDS